jgi:predicted nuclease of predicted toxin-antitoxin system
LDFKVDENLPREVAQLLGEAGHDAAMVVEQGLGGASDAAIVEACQREARTLVTLDAGFTDIRRYPPSAHPGLIVLRLRRQDKQHILDALPRLLDVLKKESIPGRLWIVEERRIRIRS